MTNQYKHLFEQKYPYQVLIRMRDVDSFLRINFESKELFDKLKRNSDDLIGYVFELNGQTKEVRMNQQHILYTKEA